MIWCWQQDPEIRPTATEVVEVAKSEQFFRLIGGIHIDDNARVLCACKREIFVTVQQKNRSLKFKKSGSFNVEMSSSYQDFKGSFSSLETSDVALSSSSSSISEDQFHVTGDENYDQLLPPDKNDSTLKRKLDAVHKYELWVCSSDVHSSRVTIIDYCGKFTGIKV